MPLLYKAGLCWLFAAVDAINPSPLESGSYVIELSTTNKRQQDCQTEALTYDTKSCSTQISLGSEYDSTSSDSSARFYLNATGVEDGEFEISAFNTRSDSINGDDCVNGQTTFLRSLDTGVCQVIIDNTGQKSTFIFEYTGTQNEYHIRPGSICKNSWKYIGASDDCVNMTLQLVDTPSQYEKFKVTPIVVGNATSFKVSIPDDGSGLLQLGGVRKHAAPVQPLTFGDSISSAGNVPADGERLLEHVTVEDHHAPSSEGVGHRSLPVREGQGRHHMAAVLRRE